MTVRSNINLQKLKKSPILKYRKIYDKAIRIMGEGNYTPLLNEEKVKASADKFPSLRVNVSVNGSISVASKCDNWSIINEDVFYTLYHENIDFRNGKCVHDYHIQDVFADLDFLLASIVSHDDYKISNIKSDMDDITEMINVANFGQEFMNDSSIQYN